MRQLLRTRVAQFYQCKENEIVALSTIKFERELIQLEIYRFYKGNGKITIIKTKYYITQVLTCIQESHGHRGSNEGKGSVKIKMWLATPGKDQGKS